MFGLSGSEMLLYGGLGVMALAAAAAAFCAAVFTATGRKLKKKLKQEYGL